MKCLFPRCVGELTALISYLLALNGSGLALGDGLLRSLALLEEGLRHKDLVFRGGPEVAISMAIPRK